MTFDDQTSTSREIIYSSAFSPAYIVRTSAAVSAGSGFVGGLFAPAMFLGASFGSAYAKVVAMLLPTIGAQMAAPPAYAMVGMAAVLAASVRAPLTAILMLFELTRDYRIVLPLMASGISLPGISCRIGRVGKPALASAGCYA